MNRFVLSAVAMVLTFSGPPFHAGQAPFGSVVLSDFDSGDALGSLLYSAGQWRGAKRDPGSSSMCEIDSTTGALGSRRSMRWSYETQRGWADARIRPAGPGQGSVDFSAYDSVAFYVKGQKPGRCGLLVRGGPRSGNDHTFVDSRFEFTTEWRQVVIDLTTSEWSKLDMKDVFLLSFFVWPRGSGSNVIWIDEITCHKKGAVKIVAQQSRVTPIQTPTQIHAPTLVRKKPPVVPSNGDVENNRWKTARYLLSEQRFEEAARAFESVIPQLTDPAETLNGRLDAAYCWEHCGRKDAALAVVKPALKLTLDEREAAILKDAFVWLEKGHDSFPCFRGKYCDSYLPPWFAKRAEEMEFAKTLDVCIDLLRQLTGASGLDVRRKQIVQYCPLIGSSHSGNPAEIGRDFLNANRDQCWGGMANIVHEVAHNFHDAVPNLSNLVDHNRFNPIWHWLCVIDNTWIDATLLKQGTQSGLSPIAMHRIRQCSRNDDDGPRNSLKVLAAYEVFVRGGNKALQFDDCYAVGAGIWRRLIKEKGLDICPVFFRELAALPGYWVREATTSEKKNALLVACISRAYGEDLFDRFVNKWGMPLDRVFYDQAKQRR
jgi:hypothetical protein